MLDMIINKARELAMVEGFNGSEFAINNKLYFVDLDSDDTLFITHEVAKDDWDILIDDIIL